MRVWALCKSPSAVASLRLENGQEEAGVCPPPHPMGQPQHHQPLPPRGLGCAWAARDGPTGALEEEVTTVARGKPRSVH